MSTVVSGLNARAEKLREYTYSVAIEKGSFNFNSIVTLILTIYSKNAENRVSNSFQQPGIE